jgi:hypothetical protein
MSDPFTNYEEYESDLGLDDDDRKQAKAGADIEWYKGVKNKTDRVAIVYFHPVDVVAVTAARKKTPGMSKDDIIKLAQKTIAERATSIEKKPDELTVADKLDLNQVHFKKMNSHYQEGLGFVISRLGKDGAEGDEVWKRLPEMKTHFSTLLLVYPTNRDGTLDKERFANGWVLKPWRFSPKRYDSIWKVNNTLGLNGLSIANQDLLLECKDDKFQQIEISGAGPALWLRNPKFKEMVLAKATDYYDKLVPFREMSTPDLRAKIGMAGSAVQDVSGGDFNDLLENV